MGLYLCPGCDRICLQSPRRSGLLRVVSGHEVGFHIFASVAPDPLLHACTTKGDSFWLFCLLASSLPQELLVNLHGVEPVSECELLSVVPVVLYYCSSPQSALSNLLEF